MENKRAEWMRRMSERSRMDVENSEHSVCGQYLKRIRFLLSFAKKQFLKYTHMSFCLVFMIIYKHKPDV